MSNTLGKQNTWTNFKQDPDAEFKFKQHFRYRKTFKYN